MAIKKQSQINSPRVTPEQADILAKQLADKPYGESKPKPKKTIEGELIRTSVSLPKHLLEVVEDLAMTNKRNGSSPKSVSAIVRIAIELYLTNHPPNP